MVERAETKISTRNSKARELSRKPVTLVVEILNDVFPKLEPNHVTALGTTGILVLSIYTLLLEKKGKIDSSNAAKLLAAFLVISLSDALDGGLARLKAEKGEGNHDSNIGELVDTLSDRLQEAFLSWLSMCRADEQGDKLALTAALATALANPLSSFFRAWAEANGVIVPESGKGVFDLFGTRVGKVVAASVRFLPRTEVAGVSVQAIVDTLVATATIKVAVSRFKAVLRGYQKSDESEKDLDVREVDAHIVENAKIRFKWLGALATVTGVSTVVILRYLLNKKSK
jgi:phosphatidylglycerophosphate synthase